jgi:hypothetical protein
MSYFALITDKNFDKVELFSGELRKTACGEAALDCDVTFPAANAGDHNLPSAERTSSW